MSTYTREQVEDLLPLMWDPEWFLGPGQRETAPDGDMPRGYMDPSHGGNWMAEVCDIRTAWRRAPLTMPERRRLILYYGQGLDQHQIAAWQGVARQTIGESLTNGIDKLLETINGGKK